MTETFTKQMGVASSRGAKKNNSILAAAFVIGLLVAIAENFYYEYTYDHKLVTDNISWLVLLCFNPPSFLGVIFIDIQPTKTQLMTLHSVVALLNAALYAWVTSLFLRINRRFG